MAFWGGRLGFRGRSGGSDRSPVEGRMRRPLVVEVCRGERIVDGRFGGEER